MGQRVDLVVLGTPGRPSVPEESIYCTQQAHMRMQVSARAGACKHADSMRRCLAQEASGGREHRSRTQGGCSPHRGSVRRSPALREAAAPVSGR